ncbi:MAG: TIGR03663 family protein [Dehalococcoidia bacterium]|nr:TIGR03663 family protein [Dehalococcoidia bacterium]
MAMGAIVVIALLMRTFELGVRASHHDESLHALFSYDFAQGNDYRHDPMMHGPLQFHLIALVFKLFGASDALSRVPAALFGSALVAMPLLLRRYVGVAAVLAMAVLLAISPSLLYYSRFTRNEAFVAVETLLLAVAIWRYREEGGMRWLVAISAAVALEFATKETAFLIAAVFLLYVNGILTGALVDRLHSEGRRRFWRTLLLFPVAWLVAATWPVSAARFGEGERPREVDLMVVLGTLVLPYLAAAAQLPLVMFGLRVEGDSQRLIGGLLVTAFMVAAGEIGIWWDWRRWLILTGIAMVITTLLFTTFFTNPAGFAGAYWNQLDYWLSQQSVQRGTQPWFYYLFMVPLYEFAALLPAVIGGAVLISSGDRLAKLLVWWALGTFLALTLAGEKMPWLTVHVALPLAILAGYVLGQVVGALRAPAGARRVGAALAFASMAFLVALSIRNGAAVSYNHPDTPIEPLIYTQTSPDIPVIARQIEAYSATRGGKELHIVVDAAESMSWPWAWYLRDYKNATYVDNLTDKDIPEGAVVLLWRTTERTSGTIGLGYATSEPYVHRWWFPEETYRAATLDGLSAALLDGSLPRSIASFYVRGEERWRVGTLDGVALFPETPPEVTIPSTGETYGR